MIEKIKKNKWFLAGCIFIFIYFFIRLSGVDLNAGDDPWFRKYVEKGLVDFIYWRWSTWSSRIILEGILLEMLKLPSIVWLIITSSMFVLIYYSILKILDKKQSLLFVILVIYFMLSIDFSLYGLAGWYATTINYVYVFGLGSYALSFIPYVMKDKNIKKGHIVTVCISTLIASNQEQMCALLIGFFGVAFIWYILKYKKINILYAIVLIICLFMLMVHTFCPGNALRIVAETRAYYPDFEGFNLLQKLYIGIVTTIAPFVCTNISQLIVYLLLVTTLGIISKKRTITILSFVPIFLYIFIRIIVNHTVYSKFNFILTNIYISGQADGVPKISNIDVTLIFLLLILGLLCLYITAKTCSTNTWISCGLLMIAAVCSHIILGFSASVFVSGMRTFIFSYYLIGICDLLLINAVIKKIKLMK